MEPLLTALMVWASSYMGLPVPEQLPNVVTADRCDIEFRVTGKTSTQCLNDSPDGVQAAYNFIDETIFVQPGIDPANLKHQAILLHELARHVQWRAGIDFLGAKPCRAEVVEKPAYDAMFAYLTAAGVEDPYALMGMNKLFYFFITSCHESPVEGR